MVKESQLQEINIENILYNCGSSFKDLGKKCFLLNKIESKKILNELIINYKI